MTGEMFAARRHTRLLQLVDDDLTKLRDGLRLLAERAIADDRIFRVGVDVEDGGVIERDPDRLQFGGERAGELPRKRGIAAAAEHRHWWPFGKWGPQARNPPPFLVDADPRRQLEAEIAN